MTPAASLTERDLIGQSALARELVRLRPSVRSRLGIHDEVIIVLDCLIAVIRAVDNPEDQRPWPARLEAAFGLLDASLTGAEGDGTYFEHLTGGINRIADEDFVERIKSLPAESFKRFLRRLVGEGAYIRLTRAVQDDGRIALAAIRKGLRKIMPLALAFDDSVSFLTPEQIAEVEGMDKLAKSALTIAIELDTMLDQIATKNLSLDNLTVSDTALDAAEGIEALFASVQETLLGQSRQALEDLSARLSRKIQGARDVLDVSADGNSQAASSLVEFVDRLLRSAFDDKTVLRFASERFPGQTDLTYDKAGKVAPTKKAQALCFMYAGQATTDPQPLLELVAGGVVTARSVLQAIKHADKGTPEEADRVREAIRAVEGFFVVAVRVGWAGASPDHIQGLRTRLGE
ncbi:hypothetical protein [Promicromonospora sp. NPDC090134]|uniref:hypothetical protein n=1 Tax=Promicromonospora sp. NPDC090134 TaxID=3364408 RepID=UPI00380C5466